MREEHCPVPPSSKYTSVSKGCPVPWATMGIPAQKNSQEEQNDALGNGSHTRNNTDANCIQKYSVVFSNHSDNSAEKLCLSHSLTRDIPASILGLYMQ